MDKHPGSATLSVRNDALWLDGAAALPVERLEYALALSRRSCCQSHLAEKSCNNMLLSLTRIIFFLYIFFGGLECVGHSFAYVAHLLFLRDVWIRTQSTAVASWRATDLATHPSTRIIK